MKRILFIIVFNIITNSISIASEPDMIVMQNGKCYMVYELEITRDNVYYTTSENNGAEVKKLSKSDVLIIKKSDGTKIDPNIGDLPAMDCNSSNASMTNESNQYARTFYAKEESFLEIEVDWKKEFQGYIFFDVYKKSGGKIDIEQEKFILAGNGDEQVLNMRLLSEVDKTLSVARPRKIETVSKNGKSKSKDLKYEKSTIVIPEYVMVGNEKYAVTEVDPAAFIDHKHVTDIVWPKTLKSIGVCAFWGCSLGRIILPESLEFIGFNAFYKAGGKIFDQLYIPKSVREIGGTAFRDLGSNTSRRGFYQGSLTCIPNFINLGNCTIYGIDEEAVEDYYRRINHSY